MLAASAGRLRTRFPASTYFSLAKEHENASGSTCSTATYGQLILLNTLNVGLPSIGRHWDSAAVESELQNASETRLETEGPTAVQRTLARRHGMELAPGACRQTAASRLAAVLPPPIRSLAILYGVLEYNGAVPPTAAAARQLLKEGAVSRPHAHPLDTDLSPVALGQIGDLVHRLGYVGRPPFSYCSGQLMAACLRTMLADVEDEARLRPLPSMDSRQADLLRYLRSRRAPPGSRGLPAVQDVDLSGRSGVSRLAAARNILQLLQNHELCASPQGEPVQALRVVGVSGAVPPTTGEALMLAAELRDRCLPAAPQHLAALAAMGWFGGRNGSSSGGGGSSSDSGSGSGASAVAPVPESVAHVKAVLRVLRRADTDAATPATRGALRHLAELRRRPAAVAAAAAAAAATAAAAAGDGGRASTSSTAPLSSPASASVYGLGPCPSQLEVRAAIEEQPLSEQMMDRLLDLGWSGPMPPTHGAALALEDYLANYRTAASYPSSSNSNNNSSSGSSSHANSSPYPPRTSHSTSSAAATAATAAAMGSAGHAGSTPGGGGGSGSGTAAPYRRTGGGAPPGHNLHGAPPYPGISSNPYEQVHGVYTPPGPPYRQQQQQQQHGVSPQRQQQQQLSALVSRLGSSPEEFLTKIQIRGMFPGAVSEWYLPSMGHEEAEHLLGCLVAARRLVLDRVNGDAYDEYVERWATAEAEGDWWGMEWLWH